MPISLKHFFVSSKTDGPDPTLLRPSAWNDDHVLKVPAKSLIGNSTEFDDPGVAEPITVSGLILDGGVLSNPAGAGNDVLVGTTPDVGVLPDARVVTDSLSVIWDKTVAAIIKANVKARGVTLAMLDAGVQGDVLYYGAAGEPFRLAAAPVAGRVLTSNGPSANPSWTASSGAPHAVLQDRKPAATGGGAFASGAWRNRQLTNEVYDLFSIVAIDAVTPPAVAVKFVLDAGTYVVEWSTPAQLTDQHQSRLYNITDTDVLGWGSSAFSKAVTGDVTVSKGIARFTVEANKELAIQHQCETSGNLGVNSGFDGISVYTTVKIWRS